LTEVVMCYVKMEVYEAVMHWIKSNAAANCQHLSSLFSQLRLAQLTTAYLLSTVCIEDLIRRDTVCRDFLDEAKHYQMSQAQLMAPTGLSITLSERLLPRRSYAGQLPLTLVNTHTHILGTNRTVTNTRCHVYSMCTIDQSPLCLSVCLSVSDL